MLFIIRLPVNERMTQNINKLDCNKRIKKFNSFREIKIIPQSK